MLLYNVTIQHEFNQEFRNYDTRQEYANYESLLSGCQEAQLVPAQSCPTGLSLLAK